MTTHQALWRLLAYRPWHALACLATWVLISLTPVALGLVARAFFNALADGAAIWWLAALPLVVQGGRLLVTWISVPLNVVQRISVSALLSTNLLAQILSRPGAAALALSPGEAISRFRDDVEEVSTFTSMIRLLSVSGEMVTTIITLILMLRINAYVTVAALLPLLAVVLLAQAAGKRVHRYRAESRAATGATTGALADIFGMVQAIKLAGAERLVAAHLGALHERRRAAAVRDGLFAEVLRSVYANTANLGTGLVLLLAAHAMQAGSFTVGDFALFAAYLARIAVFTSTVGEVLAGFRQAGVSLGRMQALMPGAPADVLVAHRPVHLAGTPAEPGRPPLAAADRLVTLEADNLTYIHAGSGGGVRGAHIRLQAGSLTVITGRVGSGKTTLLRALLGLLPSQAGEIRWNGRALPDPAAHFRPPISSYTPQVPVLFSDTLRENILLGQQETEADLAAAIQAAVLEQDIADLPEGLETPVGPRGVTLSGGQVQRTAAARMFVRRPELLVFDDLSSGLDTETESRLWARLRGRPGATCLAVSHRRTALQQADQIILMQNGQVAASGSLDQLLATCAEFRAIWEGC